MVDACRLSGLSKKAWCFQEEINYHTLQYRMGHNEDLNSQRLAMVES